MDLPDGAKFIGLAVSLKIDLPDPAKLIGLAASLKIGSKPKVQTQSGITIIGAKMRW
jgi:hypothetical protein